MFSLRYPPQLQAELLPKGALPEFIFTMPEMQHLPEEINITEHFLDPNLRGVQANRVAFYSGNRVITYQELHGLVNRLGNGLRGLGISKGDRVVLRIPNCVEFVVCALALHRLGAVVIPTMMLLRERTVTYIANTAEAQAIICQHELLDEVELGREKYQTVKQLIAIGGNRKELKGRGYSSYEELIESSNDRLESERMRLDDLATMFFTSGTTGMPKGCMHMNLALLAGMFNASHLFKRFGGILHTDVAGGSPPLAFTFGYDLMMLAPLHQGIPAVLIEGRITPEKMFEAIQKYRVSLFNAAVPFYNQMLSVPDAEKKYDLSSLRAATSGSAPLMPATVEQWAARFGTEMSNAMGSSETFTCFIGSWQPHTNSASLGHPFPGWEARIIDDAGEECPPGVIGRLAIRGPSGIMYWRNPEKQMEAVVDGWSLTGDLILQAEDGCFRHVSRSDDIIKSRGYRVPPGEIEDSLMEHAAVVECTVVGAPDPVQGQRVKAFVVLREGEAGSPELVEELRQFVRQRIAPYQVPGEIEFVSSLPKTATGKVRRIELRQLEEKRYADGQASGTAKPV